MTKIKLIERLGKILDSDDIHSELDRLISELTTDIISVIDNSKLTEQQLAEIIQILRS